MYDMSKTKSAKKDCQDPSICQTLTAITDFEVAHAHVYKLLCRSHIPAQLKTQSKNEANKDRIASRFRRHVK